MHLWWSYWYLVSHVHGPPKRHSFIFSFKEIKGRKKAAVYDAELWQAHYRHICPHHGRNLTVSYNLKLSECQSAHFYCGRAATAPFLISHFLSKWKEHKSLVSLKPTTIRVGRFHLSSIITEDSPAISAEEGVTGIEIQVRQRATAQLMREGMVGQVRVKLDTS